MLNFEFNRIVVLALRTWWGVFICFLAYIPKTISLS